MPSIIGSLPDADAGPLIAYLNRARASVPRDRLDYNDLLLCLLYAALGG